MIWHEPTRLWLYDRRIIIPGPRRLAQWARKAFDATEAAMAVTIETALGETVLRRAIDWAYSPQSGLVSSRLEGLSPSAE